MKNPPCITIADLEGRRVLVTGASSGMGRAMALGFAMNGAHVAIHYHSDRAGAQALEADIIRAGQRALCIPANLAERGAGARLVKEAAHALGGLDILVNNAGSPIANRPFSVMDDAFFDATFDLNARAAFETCRAAIPLLKQAGTAGAIINVASLSAHQGGSVGAGAYGAAKAFVITMTQNLARELAPFGIRVNSIAPGYVDTPLHDKLGAPKTRDTWLTEIPLKRAGRPEEVVGLALLLASAEAAGFITGQCIAVNGGQVMLS